jgi:nanoRNase/pAp phosphatase (c-di-AMP/oligoRNAs hydrolase)
MMIALSRLFPEGGQGTARRNAWAAMSSNATRARDRREADAAITAALARFDGSGHPPAAARRASTV